MVKMNRETLKKLLLSFSEMDYKTEIDLHIHSNESDGKMTPKQIVSQAKKAEKKYIAIADHNNIEAYLSTNILTEQFIIPAVEFDCIFDGVLIHILGYGINIDNKELKSLYAKTSMGRKQDLYRLFHLRNTKEVIQKIKQADGIPVLAHPACYWCLNLDKFIKKLVDIGLEGVETYYPYNGFRKILKFHSVSKVKMIAEKYGLIKTGGSDSHGNKLLTEIF